MQLIFMTRIYAESDIEIGGRKVNVRVRDGFCNKYIYGEVNLGPVQLSYQSFRREYVTGMARDQRHADDIRMNIDTLVKETRMQAGYNDLPEVDMGKLEKTVRQIVDEGMKKFCEHADSKNRMVNAAIEKLKQQDANEDGSGFG